MKKLVKINGIDVVGDKFMYDGCHKIYIIENDEDLQVAYNYGYNDNDLHDISEIEEIYNNSCSLRFIENFKLDKYYVRQFENADFEYKHF